MQLDLGATEEFLEPTALHQQVFYKQARDCLGSRLAHYQQRPVELRAILDPHLEVLGSLQQKLTQPLIQIAVFGLVSRGKSAVLNALFGETLFPTGALNGVTQWPRSVRWSVSSPQQTQGVQIELTDTPGLDEISGEARATMARDIARCADLILFVSAGPLMPIEEEALVELAQLSKPMLWISNKADLYPDLTPETLYQSLTDDGLKRVLSPQKIVMAAASPASVQVRNEWPDGQVTVEWEEPPPQIEPLRQTLMDWLHREGLYLLSLNALLQLQATEQTMGEAIAQFYAEPVQKMTWQLWGLKAALVVILPWFWLDIVFGFCMDWIQVRRLMQTYGWSVTGYGIESLWKALALSTGLMAVGQWSMDVMDSGLLTTGFTQGAIVIYGASRVGKAARQHLVQGITWGVDGPSPLIQKLLSLQEHKP